MVGWVRGVATTAALAVALLLVAGCDPGEEPTEPSISTDTSSAAAEETTTEPVDTATPPEVQAPTPAPEASVDDHVGAIWATRYFLDLYAYMRQTGDTAQFESMSSPDCQFCAGSVENATELHEAGGWSEGGAIEFDIMQAAAEYPTAEEPNYLVRFAMIQQTQQIHRGDGSVDEVEGSDGDVVVALRYVDGRFIVSGVNFEER